MLSDLDLGNRTVLPDLAWDLLVALGAAINSALIAAMVWEDPRDSGLALTLLGGVAAIYALRGRLVRRAPA